MRLGHVALSVSDAERSTAFYRKHFGFRRVRRYAYPDKGVAITILNRDGITLEFFEFKDHRPLPAYRRVLERELPTLGVKHFSVEVPDIAGVYEKFRKAKVPLATDMRRFGSGARYFFIKDPDGILVEIMEAL